MGNSMSLALVVMAKNEATNIEACLDSAAGVDEIVVVDDESEDGTAELARDKGARVFSRKLDDFSSQLNYAASVVESDWFFILDADERFTPGLIDQIRAHMAQGPVAVGTAKRRNYAFGRRHRFGPLKPDKVPRLFPKGSVRWSGLVHSRLHFDLPEKPLGDLIHYTYKNWDHYFRKLDRYADLWAQSAAQKGKTAGMFEIWARLSWNLFKMLILNLGIAGGPMCWALCYFNGDYTLKKYMKLMELNRNPGLIKPQPDSESTPG